MSPLAWKNFLHYFAQIILEYECFQPWWINWRWNKVEVLGSRLETNLCFWREYEMLFWMWLFSLGHPLSPIVVINFSVAKLASIILLTQHVLTYFRIISSLQCSWTLLCSFIWYLRYDHLLWYLSTYWTIWEVILPLICDDTIRMNNV